MEINTEQNTYKRYELLKKIWKGVNLSDFVKRWKGGNKKYLIKK